jgi:hypothetical protein
VPPAPPDEFPGPPVPGARLELPPFCEPLLLPCLGAGLELPGALEPGVMVPLGLELLVCANAAVESRILSGRTANEVRMDTMVSWIGYASCDAASYSQGCSKG